MAEAKQLFSVQETAERWGVSSFTIRRLIDAEHLRSVSIASRRLIPLREIERCEQSGTGRPRPRKTRPAKPQKARVGTRG